MLQQFCLAIIWNKILFCTKSRSFQYEFVLFKFWYLFLIPSSISLIMRVKQLILFSSQYHFAQTTHPYPIVFSDEEDFLCDLHINLTICCVLSAYLCASQQMHWLWSCWRISKLSSFRSNTKGS